MLFENQLLKSPSALDISRPRGDMAVPSQPTSGILTGASRTSSPPSFWFSAVAI